MEIADGLMAHARRLQRGYGSPVLAMRVDSGLPAGRVREAVGGLAGDGLYWSVDREPAGVIVRQWGHTPDVEAVLTALARALGDGRLSLYEPPPEAKPVPPLERTGEVLECHLRVRGERLLGVLGPSTPYLYFRPDDAALLAGVEAALAWVDAPPAGARVVSSSGRHSGIGEVRALIAHSFAHAHTRQHIHPLWWGWESGDAFRLSVIGPEDGDVALAESPAGSDTELLARLRAAADWAAYGCIRRVDAAKAGRPLLYERPSEHHLGAYERRSRYEDVLAPGVFAAQLLGPGYAGRIPAGGDWIREELGPDVVLLRERDAAHPIAPDELAPILIDDDVLGSLPLDPLAGR